MVRLHLPLDGNPAGGYWMQSAFALGFGAKWFFRLGRITIGFSDTWITQKERSTAFLDIGWFTQDYGSKTD